ncbi:MAG TPA: hypothetical protein VJ938_01450 [Acidimicrobiia bacterium]|nr:hypothetical protein [Acidimicrobiia bacterium]
MGTASGMAGTAPSAPRRGVDERLITLGITVGTVVLAGALAFGLAAIDSSRVPAADGPAVAIDTAVGRNADYGLRHLGPETSVVAGRSVDYGLRHLVSATSAVGGRSVDYGVRHLASAVETSDWMRDDYGTRHLAG